MRESFVRCRKMLSEHTVLGCFQLTPDDFLTIIKALLSSGKLSDLKLYCICLISTFLFLRASEVLEIKLDQVMVNTSIVSDLCIECIGLWIKGKSDKVRQNMFLYARHTHPNFDPVRHLLLYVHLAKIKEDQTSFLFPHDDDPKLLYPYKTFLAKVGARFHVILGKPVKMSTHIFRKTGYLFAVWAKAEPGDIRKCARHKEGQGSSSNLYR